MVGGYTVSYGLDHLAVRRLTDISLKTLGLTHTKPEGAPRRGFTDCSALAEILSGQDVAILCLGALAEAETRLETSASTDIRLEHEG